MAIAHVLSNPTKNPHPDAGNNKDTFKCIIKHKEVFADTNGEDSSVDLTKERKISCDFSGHKLDYIPFMTRKLRNISEINLSNNNISILRTDDFRPMANLTRLDLSSNNISTLDHGLFQFNLLLKYLDLTKNHLTFFSFGIFSPSITNPIEVDLWNNEITELDISCSPHYTCDRDEKNITLPGISLESCKRMCPSGGINYDLKKLKTINVSGNFSKNGIDDFLMKYNQSENLTNLTLSWMKLDGQSMDKLSTYFKNLEALSVSHTELSTLDNGKFSKVTDLVASYNQISTLNFTTLFTNYIKLGNLNLEGNINFTADVILNDTCKLPRDQKEFFIILPNGDTDKCEN